MCEHNNTVYGEALFGLHMIHRLCRDLLTLKSAQPRSLINIYVIRSPDLEYLDTYYSQSSQFRAS